ncbi:MAG: DUF3990 domain-containing protein [Lentisphaerae bacterium]|jgi:hypothetical protein|nr:DUF3990 domain-containing protein [Lentisphaerota bacterium]
MILYHGSNVAFKSIDLAKGMPSKDFGRGFYATDSLDCAEKTARQRVARLGGLPKVMVYDCDESQLALLQSRIFLHPCAEWALFVRANRRNEFISADHNRDNRYDVVKGPIANDKLSLLFRLYERDIITVDEFAQRMQFSELYTQYSFHTERSIETLRFLEVRDVV